MESTTAETETPEGTEAVAAALARELEPGDLVIVGGEVGSGKTTFVRGACRALGVSEPVVSPTFAIGRRYAGRVAIAHLDLYRLGSLAEEEPGLLDDYLTPDAVAFVEWADAAAGELPEPAATVRLSHAGGDRRTIEIVR